MLQQSRLTESAQLEQQQDLLQRRANTNLSRLHIVSSTSTRRRRNDVVRAKSPEGRRYLKPVNGIRTKGFAQSAQRRSSVVTLGPIERLQHFYAKRELKVNKGGILGFGQDSVMRTATGGGETETGIIVNNNNNNNNDDDVDDDDDECLESPPPRPSWMDLDVETDLDVLIGYCFRDIQTTLRTWCLVTGASDLSDSSDTEGGFFCDLPELVQSVTRMMESVRNYAFHRHDLSDTALRKLRYAGLELTGVLKDLEFRHGTMNDDEGYTFNQLREHQDAVLKYLAVVEEHVFNPPHHIGRPSPGLSPEIRALINNKINCAQKHQPPPSIPLWLDPHAFVNDPMGRYHALLRDNYQSILEDALLDAELPDPHQDEEAFLAQLADGRILCTVYNNIVKRSRRPFGFINKIHHDTTRTFRVTENLRFFSAACKFRFDLVLHSFDPAEVARKTDTGFFMLKQAVEAFCECVLAELRQDAVIKAQEAGLSQYMEKALFGGRNSDQHLPL